MNSNKLYIFLVLTVALMGLQSCQQAGVNNTGSEYMPDMGHSVAYEANYYNYYYYNTWGSEDEYYKLAQPGLPVDGTVPRRNNHGSFAIPVQGSVPYYYGDSDEERERAIAELIDNPLPITDAGLEEGKNLYNIFCSTCHGEKGDGNGYLVRDDGGVYPVQPANFLLEEHLNASNGRYYHAIMHGKNLMGAYKDKISYEERWNVIHYIRSLQAKELKLAYNQLENTLNDVDQPAGADYLAANMVDHAEGHDVDLEHKDDHHHADGDEDHMHNEHGHEGEDNHDH
ncbi:MAG: c-type cytochrome [Saprospiraceae bacterium]|nr:c-type cytochrome [Saprospiraceae bacterium]